MSLERQSFDRRRSYPSAREETTRLFFEDYRVGRESTPVATRTLLRNRGSAGPTCVEAPVPYRISWSDRLPYPLRDTLRRWREMVGMIVGVGIALGIGMTFLGVSRSETEMHTSDYRRSGFDLYVTTQGGKLVAYLPGDTPGVIKQARHALAQIRALPTYVKRSHSGWM